MKLEAVHNLVLLLHAATTVTPSISFVAAVSWQPAKEIKALIGDSANKVETGTKLVDAAGETMQKVVGSVKQVTDLIAEIAAASQAAPARSAVHAAPARVAVAPQRRLNNTARPARA